MKKSIALIGKPNSGKTLLFNRLTGLNQKVANYPGITTDVKVGVFEGFEVIDMPGVYNMEPITADEAVTVDQLDLLLNDGKIGLLLFVLEATNLNASLAVVLRTFEKLKSKNALGDVPAIVALNMMDEAVRHGVDIDHQGLAKELGVELIPVSSKTGQGIESLKGRILSAANAGNKSKYTVLESGDALTAKTDQLAQKYRKEKKPFRDMQLKIDRIFLSPIFGPLLFASIMIFLFQSVFSWAAPLMDAVETGIGALSDLTTGSMADGALKDFIVDGLYGGLGSFLVFVPLIYVLAFLVGFLEDSGYLARAALITHKAFSFFGLSGKSFIPYLTGHACAIPAVYAARTIESPLKRFLTQITIPLMSCSARLPVYGLLVAAVIPAETVLGGLFGLQGLVFFLIYALGIATALVVALLIRSRFSQSLSDTPLILEMPPYRLPSLMALLRKATDYSKKFVIRAGPVIFVVTIVIWFLGYFPQNEEGLSGSYLAAFGQLIEPIFMVIDLDWKYAVAILTSFLAREVFVGTLGTLFGIDNADEDVMGLTAQIQASGISVPSGLALMVFFAVALQCVSTVAVLQQELKSRLIPWAAFVFYGVLAYVLSVVTFWIASAFV